MLEKTLEGPLDCKEIQSVHPKGNQSWVFIGRTDAEAETPILWPPDVKGWLIGKDPDAGKDWRWEEKGTTEDEMVGWHHRLDGHEFEQALEVGDRQGMPGVLQSMVAKSQTGLSGWTELRYVYPHSLCFLTSHVFLHVLSLAFPSYHCAYLVLSKITQLVSSNLLRLFPGFILSDFSIALSIFPCSLLLRPHFISHSFAVSSIPLATLNLHCKLTPLLFT